MKYTSQSTLVFLDVGRTLSNHCQFVAVSFTFYFLKKICVSNCLKNSLEFYLNSYWICIIYLFCMLISSTDIKYHCESWLTITETTLPLELYREFYPWYINICIANFLSSLSSQTYTSDFCKTKVFISVLRENKHLSIMNLISGIFLWGPLE